MSHYLGGWCTCDDTHTVDRLSCCINTVSTRWPSCNSTSNLTAEEGQRMLQNIRFRVGYQRSRLKRARYLTSSCRLCWIQKFRPLLWCTIQSWHGVSFLLPVKQTIDWMESHPTKRREDAMLTNCRWKLHAKLSQLWVIPLHRRVRTPSCPMVLWLFVVCHVAMVEAWFFLLPNGVFSIEDDWKERE